MGYRSWRRLHFIVSPWKTYLRRLGKRARLGMKRATNLGMKANQ